MNGGILQYVVIFEYATSFGVYHVLIEVGRVNAMHERLGEQLGLCDRVFLERVQLDRVFGALEQSSFLSECDLFH